MIYLAAFWPYPETTPYNHDTIWQQYLAIRYAYNAKLQMLQRPSDLFKPPGHIIVSIEEGGDEPVESFSHPVDVLYVVGSSQFRRPSEHIDVDFTVDIKVPTNGDHPLYGHQALAIALHERYGEHGDNL